MPLRDQVFTQAQRDLLASVLNRIVPPSPPIPGAGDLGVGGTGLQVERGHVVVDEWERTGGAGV